MKISKSQREEIDFMSGGTYSEQEAEEYVRNTVLGERGTENRLTERKREFDITVKMWYRDLKTGLIGYNELMKNAHPFVQKFSIPTEIEGYYGLMFLHAKNEDGLTWERWRECNEDSTTKYIRCLQMKSEYFAGLIMPLSSTEEDRVERIDLLQKCFS